MVIAYSGQFDAASRAFVEAQGLTRKLAKEAGVPVPERRTFDQLFEHPLANTRLNKNP